MFGLFIFGVLVAGIFALGTSPDTKLNFQGLIKNPDYLRFNFISTKFE
jgi:hypothetical protein